MAESGPVKEVADQLGRIFRHLLPGVLILAAARAAPFYYRGRRDLVVRWCAHEKSPIRISDALTLAALRSLSADAT